MKLVIADRLAIYVNAVYGNVENHFGITFIVATVFFAFQIYCDFAGYSNIAIGAARIMGFNLMTNFNRPYFSRSISEFWKRWHISLSTWFKDYLYISLGGNRVSIPRWYLNLLIVFTISGLWHGANWTYIIWGAINGFYLVFAIVTSNWRKQFTAFIFLHKLTGLNNAIQIVTTFILACFAWIFFRANTTEDAFQIVHKIFTEPGNLFFEGATTFVYGFIGLAVLLVKEIHDEYIPQKYRFFESEKPIIGAFTASMLIIIILSIGVFDGGQFIYFQF